MEPAALERRRGGLRVAVVALHDVVAPHGDLAHRRPVGRDVDELPVAQLEVHHPHPLGLDHPDALPGPQPRPLLRLEPVPLALPLAHRVRTVGLGEAVDVHDREAHPLGTRERRRAGRRRGGRDDEAVVQHVGPRGVEDGGDDGGRAVEVGDPLVVDQLPDRVAAHLAQAHLDAADRDQRPRRAPAVAVEHRQRPQVDAVVGVPRVQQLAQGVEIRAAVAVHDALGPPGGARRVVDRDRGALVVDRPRQGVVSQIVRGSAGQQVRVRDRARDRVAGGRAVRVDDGDDRAHGLQRGDHGRDGRRERGVDHEEHGAGVVADVADLLGGQPGVDRHEHGSRERDREVRDDHLGHVRQQVGHPVARTDSGGAQGRGHLAHALRELTVGPPVRAVHDRDRVGVHVGGALEERQRRQLGDPGLHAIESVASRLSATPPPGTPCGGGGSVLGSGRHRPTRGACRDRSDRPRAAGPPGR